MNKVTSWTVSVVLAGLSMHCGSSTPSQTDMAKLADMAVAAPDLATGAVDMATNSDLALPVYNNCTTFMDQSAAAMRTVAFGGGAGNTYTPKCILINAGQTVIFNGMFTAHPLRPGVGAVATTGSPNNPILPTAVGTTATFTFPAAGSYPYNCSIHDGGGMNGVVRVK